MSTDQSNTPHSTETHEVVDNFSDNTSENSEGLAAPADPGVGDAAKKPLSPEEYARLQKEAREPNKK